ncbi:MAG: tyrosine--tRNA ligase [Gammaproteobacteria bacterium]|nr:tyrosine--tRNA ligase [Gammaproteobacteria bacterium]
MPEILKELDARGMLVQRSHEHEFDDHLASASRTVYCGFDPTAPSLHVGNLVPLMALGRFQQCGHRPIVLVGGATGLIGDPSGRDEERQLNPTEVVNEWVARLEEQTSRFVSFEGSNAALAVNNYDWASETNLIEFLRDVGKHFSVNSLIQRDAIKSRLEREGGGISYTEFSYALVQALDFLHLYRDYNCTVQVGGNDQWGNIVSGVDLIRRAEGGSSFALTLPLVERSDGKKFGKSTGGAIWLDPNLTSPYAFYQFWMNMDDADVRPFLHYFTYDDIDEINAIAGTHETEPSRREGQRYLASKITELVHGVPGARSAERITEALFGGEIERLTENDLAQLQLDGVPCAVIDENEDVLSGLVAVGLAESKGRARALVQQGGISVNNRKIEKIDASLTRVSAMFGRFHLLRRGKKSWAMCVHEGETLS